MELEIEIFNESGESIGVVFVHERDLFVMEFAFNPAHKLFEIEPMRAEYELQLPSVVPDGFYLLASLRNQKHSNAEAAALGVMADMYVFAREDSFLMRSTEIVHRIEKIHLSNGLPMFRFVPEK
jgi:hypothetical protein